jgi:hypothetical protein
VHLLNRVTRYIEDDNRSNNSITHTKKDRRQKKTKTKKGGKRLHENQSSLSLTESLRSFSSVVVLSAGGSPFTSSSAFFEADPGDGGLGSRASLSSLVARKLTSLAKAIEPIVVKSSVIIIIIIIIIII